MGRGKHRGESESIGRRGRTEGPKRQCEGGIRLQSTEYGVRSTEGGKIAVQKCKAAGGLWKSGKGGAEEEDRVLNRVRSTEYGARLKSARGRGANGVRHVQDAERSQTPWRARLARSANPTWRQCQPYPRQFEKGNRGPVSEHRGNTTETLNKRQLGYHRMPDDLTRSFNVIE
jgi:hypothetical protein